MDQLLLLSLIPFVGLLRSYHPPEKKAPCYDMEDWLETQHVLIQTQPNQEFNFTSNPPYNVLAAKLTCAGMHSLTTTGTWFQLAANGLGSQPYVNNTDVTLKGSNMIWFQDAPLPTLSNQIPSTLYQFGEPRQIRNVQFLLTSDGTLSAMPWSINWILKLYHPKPCVEVPRLGMMCDCE